MFALSAISLTGMNAAQSALGTSAHHIANMATAGFRGSEVSQETGVGAGVGFSSSVATTAGNSLEADIVGLLAAKNQFLANLAVFRASNQLTGSLLEVAG
jgi:flagellar hook protein FlgE